MDVGFDWWLSMNQGWKKHFSRWFVGTFKACKTRHVFSLRVKFFPVFLVAFSQRDVHFNSGTAIDTVILANCPGLVREASLRICLLSHDFTLTFFFFPTLETFLPRFPFLKVFPRFPSRGDRWDAYILHPYIFFRFFFFFTFIQNYSFFSVSVIQVWRTQKMNYHFRKSHVAKSIKDFILEIS